MIKRFYKEQDGKWHVDLPEWTGSKADLQMVCGADTMLDIIAEDENEVNLELSIEPFENADKLELLSVSNLEESGAFYILKTYKNFNFNLDIWLCAVTLFVFKTYPKVIYLRKTI